MQKTEAKKFNRRSLRGFLLNPAYQLKFVFLVIGTSLFLAAANAGIFYHFIKENYAILVDLSPMTDEAKNQLYHELRQIVTILAGVSVAFSAVVGAVALWLSHRTAGPLYRFQKVFTEIQGGNQQLRIHLRPGDDFQEVAQAFNKMMDQMDSAQKDKNQKRVA